MEDFEPLGQTGWTVWRDVGLRGTGFPAQRLREICDDELAAEVDLHEDISSDVFGTATKKVAAALGRVASDSGFREAITWQNPAIARNWLSKAAAGDPSYARGRYERAIASYLQRYCLKNDSIGFFGPIGWARFDTQHAGVTMEPGPSLLDRRTTYFEGWAIQAVAEVIAARPEVWPWLRPRLEPSAVLTGSVLRLPFRKPVPLQALELRLYRQCDGRRFVRDIIGDPPNPEMVAALLRLRQQGAVRIDLSGPLVSHSEMALLERINTIADPAIRARASEPVYELIRMREAVSAAAGDPDRLLEATDRLADTFERITGSAANRLPGATYAGRTLIYEDCVRATEVHLGQSVLERLATPLGLVLDSVAWLANTVADRYEAKAREMLTLDHSEELPLLQLLTSIMPEAARLGDIAVEPAIVSEVIAEFQQRWQRVLELPEEAGNLHQVTAAAIAGRAATEFATAPPKWSGARWHSPDVMMAASSEAALAQGDVDFVLGEVHCATNTLEFQCFYAQHPSPSRLYDAAAASGHERRIVMVARQDSVGITSRLARAAEMMMPGYTYLSLGAESIEPPPGTTLLSALDLFVRRRGDELIVRHRASGKEYSFAEVAGDPLSGLVANAFRPVGGRRHLPRIVIDRLVISRESWTYPAAEPAWAFVKDQKRRYILARRWRALQGLPEQAFFRVPIERKPMAVDFRSLPLVNLLAKAIRRTATAGPGNVTITEMLPDTSRLWLRDSDGQQYTSELRMVAVCPT